MAEKQNSQDKDNVREAILSIGGLRIQGNRDVTILTDIALVVERGTTTIVVGRSGSGKTTLLLGLLSLLDPGWSVRGSAVFGAIELVGLQEAALRPMRGRDIALIPQASALALHPSVRVGTQMRFALRHALGIKAREARARGLEWLERVGADNAAAWWGLRPTELSGGMTRLVLMAMAFACEPKLVLADEPTVGLDAKGQRTLKELLRAGQRDRGMGALIATHEIGFEVDSHDRLAVLEDGRVVEFGPRHEVMAKPQHELTRRLIAAARIPRYARSS